MSYLLIFIMSVWISSQGHLMYENITGISLLERFHFLVIGYILISSCFFAYKIRKLYKKIPTHSFYQAIIIITALIECIGILCPYSLNSHDLLSQVHVICCMSGCIAFLILLFIYTRYLSYYYTDIYVKVHWFYDLGLQFLCILFIVFSRVNGYLEILYCGLICIYLFMLEKAFLKYHH